MSLSDDLSDLFLITFLLSKILKIFHFNKKDKITVLFSEELEDVGSFAIEMMRWDKRHENPVDMSLLKAVRKTELLFPNINRLIKLLLVIPVTTFSAERSFSTMKRLETTVRSTTGSSRLNGFAMPYIHSGLEIGGDDFMRRWARKGERRILTSFKN